MRGREEGFRRASNALVIGRGFAVMREDHAEWSVLRFDVGVGLVVVGVSEWVWCKGGQCSEEI